MSRSTFLKTPSFDVNETPSLSPANNPSTDHKRALRFHHRLMPTISTSNRSHESVPVVVLQSSSTKTTDSNTTTMNTIQHKSIVRINPAIKRNLRAKRRSTGILPDDVTLASAAIDFPLTQEDEEEDMQPVCNQFIKITNAEPSESFDLNRSSPPKPMFRVSRIQPTFDENSRRSFEKLTFNHPDSFVMTSSSSSNLSPKPSTKTFRREEFILRRQASDEDSAAHKRRPYEERIRTLELVVHEKDAIIHDLQRQIEKATKDLNDAEQQIYILQRDKLTLIKTLTTIQEAKPSSPESSGDHVTSTKRTGFISRN